MNIELHAQTPTSLHCLPPPPPLPPSPLVCPNNSEHSGDKCSLARLAERQDHGHHSHHPRGRAGVGGQGGAGGVHLGHVGHHWHIPEPVCYRLCLHLHHTVT